jgi:hypothetical protein
VTRLLDFETVHLPTPGNSMAAALMSTSVMEWRAHQPGAYPFFERFQGRLDVPGLLEPQFFYNFPVLCADPWQAQDKLSPDKIGRDCLAVFIHYLAMKIAALKNSVSSKRGRIFTRRAWAAGLKHFR